MTDAIMNGIVAVADLTAHPDNYNKHSSAQIERLRLSLRKFGQPRSIVVQETVTPGKYVIVAGHGVTEAARQEGWRELRADILPASWPPEKVLAYLAADNELSKQSDPDEAALAKLLEQVNAYDKELAGLAAGSEQRLAEVLAARLSDASGDGGNARDLNTPTLIRLVVDVADVGIVETAIAATGEQNRGQAIMVLCRSYLDAKGQLDGAAKGAVASESIT